MMLHLTGSKWLTRTIRTATLIIAALLWLYTSITTAFFWTIFLVWAAWRLDSRFVGVGALVLLILIPIVLSLDKEEWGWLAEQLAVYVFFLLCITVGLQIIELMTGERDDEDKDEVESAKCNVESGRVAAAYRTPNDMRRVHPLARDNEDLVGVEVPPHLPPHKKQPTIAVNQRNARPHKPSPHILDTRSEHPHL